MLLGTAPPGRPHLPCSARAPGRRGHGSPSGQANRLRPGRCSKRRAISPSPTNLLPPRSLTQARVHHGESSHPPRDGRGYRPVGSTAPGCHLGRLRRAEVPDRRRGGRLGWRRGPMDSVRCPVGGRLRGQNSRTGHPTTGTFGTTESRVARDRSIGGGGRTSVAEGDLVDHDPKSCRICLRNERLQFKRHNRLPPRAARLRGCLPLFLRLYPIVSEH